MITEVRVSLRSDSRLKAFASITIADCFAVRGLKVMDAGRGLSVAFPGRLRPDGAHQDLASPITPEYRTYLEQEVLRACWRELGGEWTAGAAVPIRPGPDAIEARAARALPRERDLVSRPRVDAPWLDWVPAPSP